MQKLIIGVSAPVIPLTQAAIGTLGSALDLNHINMRQPIVDMLSTLLGVDPVNLDYKFTNTTYIDELCTTLEALEASLSVCLRNKSSTFFIQRAMAAIENGREGINGTLYSGEIISGIRTEQEANWIREQDGIMVHMHDYSTIGQSQFHPLAKKDGDITITTSTSFPTMESMVWKAIHEIRAVTGADIKVA